MTWKEIETGLIGEEWSWQNMRNGEIISVERRGHLRAQLVTLPENVSQDNQPIDYLAKGNAGQMKRAAQRYMERN